VVKLPSPTNDISRSHVEVSLDEWHVVVADLNSTNGTTVTAPGQAPVRLRPHEPIPIEPNTEVNLADEVVFRFEVTE
jgi:pSer/pThr/pTyr-binding forkhead associated (FHA) protein